MDLLFLLLMAACYFTFYLILPITLIIMAPFVVIEMIKWIRYALNCFKTRKEMRRRKK